MNPVLIDAIRNRQVLALVYNGVSRLVYPCRYGLGKAGQELLLAYQIKGVHNSYKHHDWIMLRVDQIQKLDVTDSTFPKTAEGYERGGGTMATVYAEL